MENINIKVILDEVFGKSCNTSNNIACDTCKYKEDCNILLLSVLISNCNFCNSTVCEDSAINIYHSQSVICHI